METSESNFRFFYIILWDYRRKIIKEFSFPRTRPSSLPFIQSTIVPRRKSFVDGIAVDDETRNISAKEEERGGFFSRAADTIHYDLTVARKRI